MVARSTEISDHPAVPVERSVETAVSVVAGEREIIRVEIRANVSAPGDDESAVRVASESVALVVSAPAEVSNDPTATTESWVQVPVRRGRSRGTQGKTAGECNGDERGARSPTLKQSLPETQDESRPLRG